MLYFVKASLRSSGRPLNYRPAQWSWANPKIMNYNVYGYMYFDAKYEVWSIKIQQFMVSYQF
jgi:hypothetical protein